MYGYHGNMAVHEQIPTRMHGRAMQTNCVELLVYVRRNDVPDRVMHGCLTASNSPNGAISTLVMVCTSIFTGLSFVVHRRRILLLLVLPCQFYWRSTVGLRDAQMSEENFGICHFNRVPMGLAEAVAFFCYY